MPRRMERLVKPVVQRLSADPGVLLAMTEKLTRPHMIGNVRSGCGIVKDELNGPELLIAVLSIRFS